MIKYILFDLDDTLLDFQKAERLALSRTLTELGIAPEEKILKRYNELNLAQWKRLERGELTLEQVKTERYRLLFGELGIEESPAKATAIYEKFLGTGHFFIEGAPELLETLAPCYHLYLVSNGTPHVQHSRLASSGIEHYFDGIFISQEIGYKKPDREFFDWCFARIPGFSGEKAVIVGDSLTSDIQGGKNAGIRTIWFHPILEGAHGRTPGEGEQAQILPDATIGSLAELPDLLKAMDSGGPQMDERDCSSTR